MIYIDKERIIEVYARAIASREQQEHEQWKYDSDSAGLTTMRQDLQKIRKELEYNDCQILIAR